MKKTFLLHFSLLCVLFSLCWSSQARETVVVHGQSEVPIIDYFVVYDPSGKAVAEQRGGMAKYAQEVVDSINVVLRNSHVEGRFRLVGYMEIRESAQSINQGLGLVSAHPEVRRQRDGAKADLVVLLSEPFNDGASGLATQEAQSIDAGFSSVRASMAATSYTAAHEAAHNIGCQHSRQQVDAGRHPYAVGASRPEYRTVMSGPYDNVGPQVPIFSGMKSVWRGVQLGSATEDNVRMLRERMPIVAKFSEGNSQISFFPTEWQPSNQPQTIEVQMTTTAAYLITSDATWLKCDISSGYNSRILRISVTENHERQPRVGHLRFEIVGEDKPIYQDYVVIQQGTEPTPIVPPKEEPKPELPKDEPKQDPKEDEQKWDVWPRDIHVSAKDTIVKIIVEAPAQFSLQTAATWMSSTAWQGRGRTEVKLMIEHNEEDKARTAEMFCYFYIPKMNQKVEKRVKIVQDAPIIDGIAQRQTAASVVWNAGALHVYAETGAKVQLYSLGGELLTQGVAQQGVVIFKPQLSNQVLLLSITSRSGVRLQRVLPISTR